jgi:hypothetical protein
MATLAMNYVVNPFSNFWKALMKWTEVVGYSRAAAHLASLGYYDEAKNCMMQIAKLKK